ncbi:MAG: hypothetical protein ACR2FY_21855 [Pirellulaceae bacterium]
MKLFFSISLFGLLLVGAVRAQEKAENAAVQEKQASVKNKNDLSISAEREAAVMTFVQQNHAELKELLNHLRDNRRKDYERAIRELSRDAERIGQLKARDGKQYELEIQAWTIKSRIQLLTAHLAMGDKEEIRSQLKALLNEQIDIRTALTKHERARVTERLAKMDQEINRLENDRQKIVENQLQVLTKSAADSKNKVKVGKNGPRPGNKKPAKPTVNQPDK